MLLNETRRKICDIVNESGLPLDAIYYILRDVTNEVWEETLKQEEQERIIKEQKEKELAELENAAAAERKIRRD